MFLGNGRGYQSITVVLSPLRAAWRHSHVSQGNTVIGSNDASSWISANKHETANVLKIFTAAKTFLDVVACKIKHLQKRFRAAGSRRL